MEHEFDRETAVRPLPGGSFGAELGAGWSVGGGLNGGYLLGVLGTALRASLPAKPDPLVVSAHFLSAATAGAATVEVEVLRDGGSLATASALLRQDETTRIAALATYADLTAATGPVRTSAEAPDLPPVEECVPGAAAPGEFREQVPLLERLDLRFHPEHIGWALGQPSGNGEISAWFRLADGREPDPLSLLLVVDALPPVSFDLGLTGWAPTVELTAHVRARPAPGWLRVRCRTRNAAAGFFEEDCDVWDSDNRLVAQSRQLARQPRER